MKQNQYAGLVLLLVVAVLLVLVLGGIGEAALAQEPVRRSPLLPHQLYMPLVLN